MPRTLATLLILLPALVLAQTSGPSIVGKRSVVNDGPGDQTDPHVSGALVAYTSESSGGSEIRYHNMETNDDAPVPSSGAFDFVSDISGSTVVFTRVTSTSSIFTYDIYGQGGAQEIAPREGSNRRGAVIGGRTVAWQDFGYAGATLAPEIATFNLDTQTLTRLTDDALMDRWPSVSPDGNVIVWSKCQTNGTQCDVWQAAASQGGGFVSTQLTGAQGEDIQPDTNGRMVVYASTRVVNGVADRDIYWQPVGGGQELRLPLAGLDTNPSISGSLLAFEHYDASAATPNFDIYLYDVDTQVLFALTQTPENENLNDLSVDAEGTVRVVWTVPENGDFNVHAFTFRLPKKTPGCTPREDTAPAEEVCRAPGARALLASLEMVRTTGKPTEASIAFEASGKGVLCVDNGYQGEPATAGWVTLNGVSQVDPSAFKKDVSLLASRVDLSGGNTLEARLASKPGNAFRVRVYGPPPDDCGSSELAPDMEVIPGISLAPVPVTVSTFSEPSPDLPVGGGDTSVPGTSTGGGDVSAPGSSVDSGGVSAPGSSVGGGDVSAPVPSISGEDSNAPGHVGCSTGGGSMATLGVLVLGSLLLHQRRVPRAVRRSRR